MIVRVCVSAYVARCACVYVCAYSGIRGFVCVKEGVCVFARTDIWACAFLGAHVCVRVCERMSECACGYALVNTCACVWACERIHAHVKYFSLDSTSFNYYVGPYINTSKIIENRNHFHLGDILFEKNLCENTNDSVA